MGRSVNDGMELVVYVELLGCQRRGGNLYSLLLWSVESEVAGPVGSS